MSFHRPVSRPRATYPASASTSSSTFNFESSSTGSQPTYDQLARPPNFALPQTFSTTDEHYGEPADRYIAMQGPQVTYARSVPSTSRQDEVYVTPPRVQPSPRRRRSPSSSPSLPRSILPGPRSDDNWASFVDSIANQANFGAEFRNQLLGFTKVSQHAIHQFLCRPVDVT